MGNFGRSSGHLWQTRCIGKDFIQTWLSRRLIAHSLTAGSSKGILNTYDGTQTRPRLRAPHLGQAVACSSASTTTYDSHVPSRLPVIVFLGPPGVGKGTYAKQIAAHIGVPHIMTGELVREQIARQTPLGKEVESTVTSGGLLHDGIALSLLQSRLDRPDAAFGAVLDGYPRSFEQAQRLESIAQVKLVVNLSMREEGLVAKLLGRCRCAGCGEGYNTAEVDLAADEANGLPAVYIADRVPPGGVCTKCGSRELTRRADDTVEVIERRLAHYWETCAPAVQYYHDAAGGASMADGGPLRVIDFQITAGYVETLGLLIDAVGKVDVGREMNTK